MKRIITAAAALLLSAALITPSLAGSIDFFGNSAIYVNGQWYYCGNNTMTWCNGGAFNGGQLGTFTTTIELGAQSQVYEQDNNNPVNWNGGYVEMHYRISKNGDEMFSNTLNLQYSGMRGNNNFFQLGGDPLVPEAISIATLVAGQYNLEVWFKVPGQDIWDSNNGANYVATFTKEGTAVLANTDDIVAANVASDGNPIDVQLNGLTLFKDGYWNTICLPFGIESFSGTIFEEADVETLSSTSYSGGTLTMNFRYETSIEAGVPYIVKWSSKKDDIVNPTFTNVKISAIAPYQVETTAANFVGCFGPETINGEDFLYLGAANTLYYPENVTINAFRGYFELNLNEEESHPIKAFQLNFGDETTGIKEISNLSNSSNPSNSFYTLDGRRVNGMPTTSGLYIINGVKVLIK